MPKWTRYKPEVEGLDGAEYRSSGKFFYFNDDTLFIAVRLEIRHPNLRSQTPVTVGLPEDVRVRTATVPAIRMDRSGKLYNGFGVSQIDPSEINTDMLLLLFKETPSDALTKYVPQTSAVCSAHGTIHLDTV